MPVYLKQSGLSALLAWDFRQEHWDF